MRARGEEMGQNTGKPYETLAQIIFQRIVDQSDVRNVVVQQDVTLRGKNKNSHQIDVYWKFAVENLEYETVVEAKDWKRHVDQGALMKFKAVLDDLPGQPKGIFVSRAGYQKGARDFARTHGILIYELRESDPLPPVSIPVTGWARYHVLPMPVRGVIHARTEVIPPGIGVLGFVWDVFTPEFSNIRFEPSTNWLQQEYPRIDFARLGNQTLPATHLHKIAIFNEERSEIGNLAVAFREIAQAVSSEGFTSKTVRHTFQPSILVRTDSLPIPYIKFDAVSMDVKIEHRKEIRRGRKENFAEWVLLELNSGKSDWFLATPSARSLLPSNAEYSSNT
jgi:hypothetical protein